MSALLINRDGGFAMPADGWYQLAPLGEFAHAQAGVVQVVDRAACEAMAGRFAEEARTPNFAGALIDFDHFSLDGEKRSEAAGWITALEARCPVGSGQVAVGSSAGENFNAETQRRRGEGSNAEPQSRGGENAERSISNGDGLWAKIRWSDVGEEAVKGGRYRFLSPVWRRGDCEDLGSGRVRPMRLHNAAVTNDPNLKGLRPLSNSRGSSEQAEGSGQWGENLNAEAQRRRRENAQRETLENAGEQRFEWVLGENERHCPSCAALAGQVHTMKGWAQAGLKPGSARLFCKQCHCRLEPTGREESGDVGIGQLRKVKNREGGVMETEGRQEKFNAEAQRRGGEGAGDGNRETGDGRQSHAEALLRHGYAGQARRRGGEGAGEMNNAEAQRRRDGERSTLNAQRSTLKDGLANIGWTDVARAASLAVRRAKAAARRAKEALTGGGKQESEDGRREEARERLEAYAEEARDAFVEEYGRLPETDAEIAEAEEMAGVPDAYRSHGEPVGEEEMIERILRGEDGGAVGSLQLAVGSGEPGNGERGTGEFNAEAQGRRGKESGVPGYELPGGPSEEGGRDGGDEPGDNWGWFLEEGLAAMDDGTVADMAEEVAGKAADGGGLGEEEQAFAEALQEKAAGLVEKAWRGERLTDDERRILDALGGVAKLGTEEVINAEAQRRRGENVAQRSTLKDGLENIGWTDEARRAALEVRRLKAGARRRAGGAPPRPPAGEPGRRGPPPVYNPHYPVYRPPYLRRPPEWRIPELPVPPPPWHAQPLPGRPVPIYRLFGRGNVEKLRGVDGR